MTTRQEIFKRYIGNRVVVEIDSIRGTPLISRSDYLCLHAYFGKVEAVSDTHFALNDAIWIHSCYESQDWFKKRTTNYDFYLEEIVELTAKARGEIEKWKDERESDFLKRQQDQIIEATLQLKTLAPGLVLPSEWSPYFNKNSKTVGSMAFHLDTVNRVFDLETEIKRALGQEQ